MRLRSVSLDPADRAFVEGSDADREQARREWHRQKFLIQLERSTIPQLDRADLHFGRFGIVEHLPSGRYYRARTDELGDVSYTTGIVGYTITENGTPILFEDPPGPQSRQAAEEEQAAREQRAKQPEATALLDDSMSDTYKALIAVAPITTPQRVDDWQGTDREMYDAGGLKLIPGQTADVLVNHDDDDVLGTVDSLIRIEDTNGPWIAAIATLDRCPGWLNTRYTRASMGIKAAQTSHVFGCQITRRGFVDEVSLLNDRQPVEPLARLLTLERIEAKPAAGEVTYGGPVIRRERIQPADEMAELERRRSWLGEDVPIELVIQHMEAELRTLRRHR